jgi:hypothetical protein
MLDKKTSHYMDSTAIRQTHRILGVLIGAGFNQHSHAVNVRFQNGQHQRRIPILCNARKHVLKLQ